MHPVDAVVPGVPEKLPGEEVLVFFQAGEGLERWLPPAKESTDGLYIVSHIAPTP